jgi:hypothetical protein
MEEMKASLSSRVIKAYLSFDWLVVVVISWLLPLLFFNLVKPSYIASELFWCLPILCLLPRFFHETHPGSRRRRAFYWSAGIILVMGSFLDLAFGHIMFSFEGGPYVGQILGIPEPLGIPYEEFIFYLAGPLAMMLVYFWCDEHFLKATQPQQRRLDLTLDDYLVQVSPQVALVGLGLFLLGLALRQAWAPQAGWFPKYYTFQLVAGILPLVFFYRAVKPLVNWQALTMTTLYALITSIIWEPTLGLPFRWWGYKQAAMLGATVQGWKQALGIDFPVEEPLLWLIAPFCCVFFFEVVKAYNYHPSLGGYNRLFSRHGGWKASFKAQPSAKGKRAQP